MIRDSVLQSVILQVKPYSKENSIVTALSENLGLFDAVLYGGAKSHLRSLVQPFFRGTLWIYTDNSKNTRTIKDFVVESFHESFIKSLVKTFSATLASELVLKTKCAGGDSLNVWKYYNGFLDGLDISCNEDCSVALLRFLWRFIGILGLQPDCNKCNSCGEIFTKNGAYYTRLEEGFLCKNCCDNLQFAIHISLDTLKYLLCVNNDTARASRSVILSKICIQEIRTLLFTMIRSCVTEPLDTLDAGRKIL